MWTSPLSCRKAEWLVQGHTGHWWQKERLTARIWLLQLPGPAATPPSPIRACLGSLCLEQLTLLCFPCLHSWQGYQSHHLPAAPTAPQRLTSLKGHQRHDFTGTGGISGSRCRLSKWHASAYLKCQNWAVCLILSSFYLCCCLFYFIYLFV